MNNLFRHGEQVYMRAAELNQVLCTCILLKMFYRQPKPNLDGDNVAFCETPTKKNAILMYFQFITKLDLCSGIKSNLWLKNNADVRIAARLDLWRAARACDIYLIIYCSS
jgi:hypothetical protein